MPRSLPRALASARRASKPGQSAFSQRHVEGAGEIAAVDGAAHLGGVGEVAHEVALAHLDGADAESLGRALHQALHDVVGLGPAGAAVGVGRRRVGEAGLDREIQDRHVVSAADDLAAAVDRQARAVLRNIGTDVQDGLGAHGEDLAIGVEGQLRVVDLVAAVVVGHEGLAAVAVPLDRALELARRVDGHHQFGIALAAHAEAAAGVVGHQVEILLRLLEDPARHGDDDAAPALGRRIERGAVLVGLEIGQRAARLHGHRHDAVVHQVDRDDLRRLGEGFVRRAGLAILPVQAEIAAALRPYQGRVGVEQLRGIGDRRQLVVVDHDQFGRVARLELGLGDHHGDQVADAAHAFDGQRMAGRLEGLLAGALVLELEVGRDRRDLVGEQVLAGVDGDDAGRGQRLARCRSTGSWHGPGASAGNRHGAGRAG